MALWVSGMGSMSLSDTLEYLNAMDNLQIHARLYTLQGALLLHQLLNRFIPFVPCIRGTFPYSEPIKQDLTKADFTPFREGTSFPTFDT